MAAFTLTQSVVTSSSGVPKIELSITVNPDDPIGTFDRFAVWRQRPDGSVSAAQYFHYDGDPEGVGSARYGNGKALYDPPASTENWKIFVTPKSKNSEPVLDLLTSPNETISVSAVASIIPQIPVDVTIVSVTVSLLAADGNGDRNQRFVVTYNPPTPISPLQGVSAYMVPPDGEPRFLGDYDYDGDGSGSTPGRYGTFFRDLPPASTAGETWVLYLVPYSSNYRDNLNLATTPHANVTALSYTGGLLPALPASVGGVVGAQASSGQIYRQRGTSDLLETRILVTINMPSGHTATGATIWVDADPSLTVWDEVGNFPLDSDTQTVVEFWWTAPLGTTGWKVKLITYGSGGWNDPNSAVESAFFTVNAATTLTGGLITNAAQVGAITYTQGADGQYYYGFRASWTNPNRDTQPYWWLTKVYVREVDSLGNPVAGALGELRPVDEFSRSNESVTLTIPDRWIIPPSGQKVRIYLYCVDLLAFEVLQTTAWSGQPYLELTPVAQVGGAGVQYAPVVTGFTGTAQTGFFGEDGGQMYYFTARFTIPSGASYQGCKIYAAPRGVISATNGSGVYNRFSGPYFNAGQIGQKIDLSGVIITISAVNSATQIVATTWTASSGNGTSVMLGESRQVIVLGPDSATGVSPRYPIQHVSEDFRVYALSVNYAGEENAYAAGVTPFSDVTVSRSSGSAGQEFTGVVTSVSPETNDFTGQGLSISNCNALLLDSGILVYFVSGTYADPVDPATGATRADFGGVKFVRLNAADPMKSIEVADYGKGVQKFRSDFQPSGSGVITFALLSYDTSGRMNQYQAGVTPTFNATTPAQTNTLNLARALPGSLTAAPFAANIRPIALVAALPSLPDPNFPVGSEAYITPSGPKYRVTPGGSTWELGVRGQDIVADSITAVQIAAGAIGASEIATGDLLVGGLGKLNSRLIVRDLSNNIVVAMGDFGGVQMFHAINARIGVNVNAPFFYADSSQIALGANALGFANVSITAGGVSFQNCVSRFAASDGTVVSINNDVLGGAFRGLATYNAVGVDAVIFTPGFIQFHDNVSSGVARVTFTSRAGQPSRLVMTDASGNTKFNLNTRTSGQSTQINVHDGAAPVSGRDVTLFYDYNGGILNKWKRYVAGLLVDYN